MVDIVMWNWIISVGLTGTILICLFDEWSSNRARP